MPVWVIFVVAGILLVAGLVLVIAIHILDVHAEEQCAHLHDLTHRSLQQNQTQSQYQYRCGDSQLCCVCGSVRNRRPQGNNGGNTISRPKSCTRTSTGGALLQPLMDAAYGKTSLGSGSLDCFSGLTSRRNAAASGLQGGWFNTRNLFRSNGGFRELHGKSELDSAQSSVSVAAVASAASGSSSSAGPFASTSRTVGSSVSGSMTTITATITTTGAPSSAPSTSTTGPQASSGSIGTEGDWKPLPQRRLVLEILMSPSGAADGQGGTLPRATGVRLKLETNASLESLASLASAASSGVESSFQPQEAETSAFRAGLASTSCGTMPVVDAIASRINDSAGNEGSSNRVLSSNTQMCSSHAGLGPSSLMESYKRESASQGVSTAMCNPNVANKVSTTDDCLENNYYTPSMETANCSSQLDKKGSISGSSTSMAIATTGISNSSSMVANKSRPNSQMAGVASMTKPKVKVGSGSTNASVGSNLSALVPGCGTSGGPNATPAKGAHNQASFNSSLDGLGSLRISVLDGGTKSKLMKDCSKGVTAEIASALAALNVESIGGKGVGMGSALGVGGASSDTTVKVEKVDAPQEEEIIGEGSGSDQVVEEGDENQLPVHVKGETVEEDEIDGIKKEKRKKKNRGRRQKAKAAAVAAAAASVDEQYRHSHEKHCVGAVENANIVTEVEVGCICGTPKGSCHSIGCPYPFTSSGSMVQRKIKEQYDELVRSNIAKTLTLAQVGRFTTCLVEAKSALQQKSDTIQRRFTIAKSLLSKADKSSFDRLCGQIYGLEIEQKKLEEDTVVYNRLQEQLKLSPAYQKMLEYGRTHFELQPNTGQLIEKVDNEEMEISFEELLAQEKKDSFWQKHGPSRSSVQVS